MTIPDQAPQDTLTSPWDCPVHGPQLENFLVRVIVGQMLEDVAVGDDDRNIRVAEEISRVKSMNEGLAIDLVMRQLDLMQPIPALAES